MPRRVVIPLSSSTECTGRVVCRPVKVARCGRVRAVGLHRSAESRDLGLGACFTVEGVLRPGRRRAGGGAAGGDREGGGGDREGGPPRTTAAATGSRLCRDVLVKTFTSAPGVATEGGGQ